MIKRLLILIVAVGLGIPSWGQDVGGNLPQKGDFTVSAALGYNSYVSHEAFRSLSKVYEMEPLGTEWFDEQMMVGLEGSYFFSDKWSVRLGGGFSYTLVPGKSEVPGTYDDDSVLGDGSIPGYRAVATENAMRFNVLAGVDRHFSFANVKNLSFHLGFHLGYAYSLHFLYYNEELSMGKSIAEGFNARGIVNTGLDYHFLPNMYAGIEVNALQYTYSYAVASPEEGLGNLMADSHNASFLAAPAIKIGFRF